MIAGLAAVLALSAATAAEPLKDTAGRKLPDVWKMTAARYADAYLSSITGRTDASGAVSCDPKAPFTDGWRYHFYSAKERLSIVIGRCGDAVTEPLKEMLTHSRGPEPGPVKGDFIDSDRLMEVLAKNGLSLDPADYGSGGKQPFLLTLRNPLDQRFKDHPVFWEVRVGGADFMVNAETEKMLHRVGEAQPGDSAGEESMGASSSGAGPAASSGTHPSGIPPEAAGSGAKPDRRGRVRHSGSYTAKADLGRVQAYARAKLPGEPLMAVDGISDAWGTAFCMGAGDGWAFYFYNRRTRGFDALFACKGEVGPGPRGNVPVRPESHEAVTQEFIDSDKAFDLLLADEPNAMDEGLGRDFTRRAVLRLLQYRAPPFLDQGVDSTLFWEIVAGSDVYYVDAARGVYIGSRGR